MTFSDRDWLQALEALGVRATTAPKWNTAFADEVQPEKFSAGMEDLRPWLAQVLHEYSMLERTEECLSYNPGAPVRRVALALPDAGLRGALHALAAEARQLRLRRAHGQRGAETTAGPTAAGRCSPAAPPTRAWATASGRT
jgi:hypothetical protein